MYYFYYILDFNVLDFLLCSYFINFNHQRFNSLNRVKFKRRLIRSNEARRPQTTYNFILVIYRTDLLSQGIIRCLLFLKKIVYIQVQRGQVVRNRMCSRYGPSPSEITLLFSVHTAISTRKVVRKNVQATIPKGDMG